MRGAWTVVLGLVVSACGGRLDAEAPPVASDASSGVDSGPTIVDASTSDTSSEIDCVPTDGGATTCSGNSFCVAWVGPDAAVPHSQSQFPPDVLRSACGTGPFDTACAGQAPSWVRYNPYSNRVSWVVCVEP